jgi:DNA-binding CsgD family transcriptional regulator
MSPLSVIRGRDAELERLGARFDAAAAGSASVVLVEGAPGIGKTSLLAAACARARAAGLHVCAAQAEPGEQLVPVVPTALLLSALDSPAPAGPSSAWPVAEVEAQLERRAVRAPLLVCLDDVQWADPTTIQALGILPGRLVDLPIVWLVAGRPDVSGGLEDMRRRLVAGGADQLTLGPLAPEHVAQVAADVLAAPAAPALLDLARQANGNPFLLVELLRGLGDEGLVAVRDGRTELRRAELPARVRETMRQRLARLTPEGRRAAGVASVLGRRFPFEHLAAMLGMSAAVALGPVDELLRSDLLEESEDGRYAFRHDLVREAVRETLPGPARRLLQREAVDVLLATGASPVEVAAQLARSAEPGDRIAAEALLVAARTLTESDPAAGAALAMRGLDLLAPDDPLRGPLVSVAVLLLHHAGRADEGRRFADGALATLPAEQQADVDLRIASMFAISADDRARAGRRALALDGISDIMRARHLARLVGNLVGAGRWEEAEVVAGDAEAIAAARDDALTDATLAWTLPLLDYATGHYLRAAGRLATRHAGPAADESQDRAIALVRNKVDAVVASPEASLERSEPELLAAQRGGAGWAAQMWERERSLHLLRAGRLADAAAALEPLATPDETAPIANGIDAAALTTLGRIALHQGDDRRAAACVAAARPHLAATVPEHRRHAAWLMALHALVHGTSAEAVAVLARLGEPVTARVLPTFPTDLGDPVWLVRIALAAGDATLARSAVDLAELRVARNPGLRSVAAHAAHARGLLEPDPLALAAAAAELGAVGRRLPQAQALEDAGVAWAARGERDAAVDALGDALERFAAMAAARDADRVRERLRAHGVRRRLAPPRPQTGWEALTDAERSVARLVAEGLTNREVADRLVVSPHTVSTHLRRAFVKLSINSRADLARLLPADAAGVAGA